MQQHLRAPGGPGPRWRVDPALGSVRTALMHAILSAQPAEDDMRTFTTIDELEAAVGEELGTTDWIEIDQDRVDLFADATDDHQWIHVDQERAAAGPFGGTIAHGYLTLSLIPWLSQPALRRRDAGRPAQLRAQQGPLPQPRQGRPADPRAAPRSPTLTDVPAGKQLTVALHDRDRGRGQAGLRRRDGRPAARLSVRRTAVSFASPCVGHRDRHALAHGAQASSRRPSARAASPAPGRSCPGPPVS